MPGTGYTRQDVLRILQIDSRQLKAWEKALLIPPSESYSFQELGHLRKLRDLRAMHLSPSRIRASVDAMRTVCGVADPLLETGTVCNGSRVAFRYSGGMMEPIARQFVFDFGTSRRPEQAIAARNSHATRESSLNAQFSEAVQFEGAGKLVQAALIYQNILDTEPGHAPACINLGTICYNQRKFNRAEELYRRATEVDPDYALAYFDLGNALDELQRLQEAIAAYHEAIRLVPGYADAHYNLALAFERTAQPRKALRHWMAYLKLDSIGPWANHARGQAQKILGLEKLSIVHRGKRITSTTSTPSTSHLRAV